MNFKSISLDSLEKLLEKLSRLEGFTVEEIQLVKKISKKEQFTPDEIDSDWIRKFLLEGGEHPAKKYPDLFSKVEPYAGLTYQWTLGLGKKDGLLSFTSAQAHDCLVWLDILFIDQLSDDVSMHLAKAQEIYRLLPEHLVIPRGWNKNGTPSLLLSRGWCLYELCLRSIAGKKSTLWGDERDLGFKGDDYDYAGAMNLTQRKDREAIERALSMVFGNMSEWSYRADRSNVNQAIVKQIRSMHAKRLHRPQEYRSQEQQVTTCTAAAVLSAVALIARRLRR